jgi:membrane fusion protein, heavy metal efflux system
MPSGRLFTRRTAVIAGGAVAVVVAALLTFGTGRAAKTTSAGQLALAAPERTSTEARVVLTSQQLRTLTIAPVGTYLFPIDKDAVGSIDYDENLSVQVFPPYQGKILATLHEVGDPVQRGQALYTIDSPDLIQAESNLIGAAATLELTRKELVRAHELYVTDSTIGGVSEREYEQAQSDEQTAEGALRAARSAVRVFGKTDDEMDETIRTRHVDNALVVPSPITGQVTSRDAQPGLLVQPGNPPAPYAIANIQTKWMLANVLEGDSPLYHIGQPVQVTVTAFPGRAFTGTIDRIYPAVDTVTHRITVRSQIVDPGNLLRPGMLADFVIQVRAPTEAPAVPTTAIVHEGDGTLTAWVTRDRKTMYQRVVSIGAERDGQYQVLEGLHPGELVVTRGGVFLSNMLQASPSD